MTSSLRNADSAAVHDALQIILNAPIDTLSEEDCEALQAKAKTTILEHRLLTGYPKIRGKLRAADAHIVSDTHKWLILWESMYQYHLKVQADDKTAGAYRAQLGNFYRPYLNFAQNKDLPFDIATLQVDELNFLAVLASVNIAPLNRSKFSSLYNSYHEYSDTGAALRILMEPLVKDNAITNRLSISGHSQPSSKRPRKKTEGDVDGDGRRNTKKKKVSHTQSENREVEDYAPMDLHASSCVSGEYQDTCELYNLPAENTAMSHMDEADSNENTFVMFSNEPCSINGIPGTDYDLTNYGATPVPLLQASQLPY